MAQVSIGDTPILRSRSTCGNAYHLDAALYSTSFDLSGQDSGPKGMAWKNDGTKFVILGGTSDAVYSYTLTTAYDIRTASPFQSLSVSTNTDNPHGVTWNNDGSKLYIPDIGTADIHSYMVSTPYDISSASYNQSFSTGGQDTVPTGMGWNDDGSKLYVTGTQNVNVYSYNVGTAFDISTASFNQSYDVSGQDSDPVGIVWNDTGSVMYIAGISSNTVYSYSLGISYDISTATTKATLDVSGEETGMNGLAWNGDGSTFYAVGQDATAVHAYTIDLTEPITVPPGEVWDVEISSPGTTNININDVPIASVTAEDMTLPGGTEVCAGAATNKLVVAGYRVDQTVSNTPILETTTAWADNYALGSLSVDETYTYGEEVAASDVAWNDDGTRLYYVGPNNDGIFQYTLDTPYVISTATMDILKDIRDQDNNPTGMAWNNDGTKLYVTGTQNTSVYSYTLGTAYDVSTATFNQSYSITQDSDPTGLTWNDNGTLLYIVGNSTDIVYSYVVDPAFDISSASANTQLDVSGQDTDVRGMEWDGSGGTMYVAGASSDDIYSYTLGTDYDITTASLNTSYDVSGELTPISGLAWDNSGAGLVVADGDDNALYSYTTIDGTEITVPPGEIWDVTVTQDSSTVPVVNGVSLAELPNQHLALDGGNRIWVQSDGDSLALSGYKVS